MENILEILDIPDNTKYWLVRAGQGEEYEDFKKSGIIGLRYDKLTLDEIHSIKNKPILVQEYTTYTSKKGKIIKRKRSDKAIARDKENFHKTLYKSSISKHYKLSKSSIAQIASRIENFVHKMNIGDIVIVPYISSRKFLVGVITSDTYEITIEEQKKLEAKAQKEYELKLKNNQTVPRKHKVSISRKRRNVKWLNEVDKSELSPKLFYTITMHQSIIDISEFGEYIDRISAPLYIKDSKLHLPLKITTEKSINSELWGELFELLNCNKNENEIVNVKTHVESPGWIVLEQLWENKESISFLIAFLFGNLEIKGVTIKGLFPYLSEKEKRKEEIRGIKIDNDHKEKNNEIIFKINKEELEKKKLENAQKIYELESLGITLNKPTNVENENQEKKQKDSDDLSDEE